AYSTVLILPYSSSSLLIIVTATPVIYSLPLHDALPISALQPKVNCFLFPICWIEQRKHGQHFIRLFSHPGLPYGQSRSEWAKTRSEEHTSELQSRENLVCRLLLEKKNRNRT